MFPDVEHVRDMQKELDIIIQTGVVNLTQLLRKAETSTSSGITDDSEDDFEIQRHIAASCKPAYSPASDITVGELKRDSLQSKLDLHRRTKSSLSENFQHAKLSSAGDTGSKSDFGSIKLKPGQRLTDQLVKRGLLTKDMLERLQRELMADASGDDSDSGMPSRKV
jgi:ATP-dependent RNA helicase SUPV3L1/SUV3